MRPVVAMDLDNVVVNIIDAAKDALAAMLSISTDEILETNIYDNPFCHQSPDMKKHMKVNHDFWQRDDVLAAALPIEGAREALWSLHNNGQLAAYVTRRSHLSSGITRAWLEIHEFPLVKHFHVGHHEKAKNYDMCKAAVCLEIGATHLVDDSQKEAQSALRKGVTPVLVDHPLGRADRIAWLSENPDVILVKDVRHAAEILVVKSA